MTWRVVYARQARTDAKHLVGAGLRTHVEALLELIAGDPLASPPRFERLVGDLAGAYARRINIHHRLVYQVLEAEHVVKVLRMWTHYE